MSRCRELAARAARAAFDPGLQGVRRWKEGSSRRKALGLLPVFAPVELVHAAGFLPVRLFGGGEGPEGGRGDSCIQSYVCHLPRGLVEREMSGSLDALDGLLFPASCDVLRNLPGLWALRFPGRFARVLELPQASDPRQAREFFRAECHALAAELRARGGRAVTRDRLRRSVALYDLKRARIEELYDLRDRDPSRVPSAELYAVVRAEAGMTPGAHNRLLKEYRDAAMREDRRPQDRARVVVWGAFCEQPPLGLIRAVEAAGCSIVDDDFHLGSRWVRGPVPDSGDPLEALVSAYLDRHRPASVRYDPDGAKERGLVEVVRRRRADGVIFCSAGFCDPALLDLPLLQAALQAAGIPHVSVQFCETQAQFRSVQEQAGTFADSLRLGEAS